MFVGLWAGLHQLRPLSVDLDQRQDVPVPHRLVQTLQPRLAIGAELADEAFLRVLGGYEVLPRLPGRQRKQRHKRAPSLTHSPLASNCSAVSAGLQRHSHVTAGIRFGDVLKVGLQDLVEAGVPNILGQLEPQHQAV